MKRTAVSSEITKAIRAIVPNGATNIAVSFSSKESATYTFAQGDKTFEKFLEYVLFQYNYHTTPDYVDFGITQLSFVLYDLDGKTHEIDVNAAVKAQYFASGIDAVAKTNTAHDKQTAQ